MIDVSPASTPEALAVVVAERLTARIGEVSASMRDRLASAIVELDGDEAIVALLHASIEGNVENILISTRLGIGVENIEPPSAAYEYARRLAQREVPLSALVRAYRLGQQHLLEQVFVECARLTDDQALCAAAYHLIVTSTFDYIDWISQGVVAVYETERERWLAERNSVRVGRVEELVAGTVTDPAQYAAVEAALGYRLRVPHLAAWLWVHETGAQQDQIARFNRAAVALAEHLGATRAPLVVPRDRTNAWAWFPVPADVVVDPAAVRTLLERAGAHDGARMPRVALGRVHSGVAGFRASHLDAQQARRVALIRDDADRPVLSFAEPGLSVAALLSRDLDTTRAWVQETLGALALDDEQHERLRTTLALFFRHDSNYTATAEAMLMHKNSVKYRLASAEKALGRPIQPDRQAIELALTACDWLGRAVLRTPEPAAPRRRA